MSSRAEEKASIHASHVLSEEETEIRCPGSTPRFYGVRRCIHCEAEVIEHPAGLFVDNDLKFPCLAVAEPINVSHAVL